MSSEKRVAIIDYGMGNLRSVQKALENVGIFAAVTDARAVIADAYGVVLPGVGSFIDCMRNLERHGLVGSILGSVRSGKPFLGICLGLQALFSESEEFGLHPGLDVFKGRVVRFSSGPGPSEPALKIPHMGWNSIRITKRAPHFSGVGDGAYFYFVHSYYVKPDDPGIVASTTEYGTEFVSSVWKDNVFACQFHPEKSQALGLGVLREFGKLI
jgi:imidazole glycerol-phosphate synthase subunit HisH